MKFKSRANLNIKTGATGFRAQVRQMNPSKQILEEAKETHVSYDLGMRR